MFPISIVLVILNLLTTGMAFIPPDLKEGYYHSTCPDAEKIVRKVLKDAMCTETRYAASILRLTFHDCFVNGCDGSVLLDDRPGKPGEKNSLANTGSVRGFEVIDAIKAALEKACPGVVSCADIITMASREAVVLSGGPNWEVKLGRTDSFTASLDDSNRIIPSSQSTAAPLIALFQKFGLTPKDLVILSGTHTIGDFRCFTVTPRVFNFTGKSNTPDPSINRYLREDLKISCPSCVNENATVPLDATPRLFDNTYFKELIQGRGRLQSDQALFEDARTKPYVKQYASSEPAFFRALPGAMRKISDLRNTREKGEIRRNCRFPNRRPN